MKKVLLIILVLLAFASLGAVIFGKPQHLFSFGICLFLIYVLQKWDDSPKYIEKERFKYLTRK